MSLALARRGITKRRGGFYGVLNQADGLNNMTIGSPSGRRIGIKDRSEHTGSLTSIDVYIKQDTPGGYSGGTLGQFTCRCESDDGSGLPSGSLISAGATVTVTSLTDSVQRFTFGTPVADLIGTLRHFVFQNVDGSPTVNFSSINSLYLAAAPTPVQPTYLDADRGVIKQLSAPPWVFDRDRYPIFATNYADGYVGGQATYDAKSISGQREIRSTTHKVRLNFTPTVPVPLCTGARFRLFKQASTAGALVPNLRNLTAASLLETTSITAASVASTGVFNNGSVQPAAYQAWTFAAPHQFVVGTNYALELTAPSEATVAYVTWPSQMGGNGFGAPLDCAQRFLPGYWEYSTNGSVWNLESASTDWQSQFYFITA